MHRNPQLIEKLLTIRISESFMRLSVSSYKKRCIMSTQYALNKDVNWILPQFLALNES